MPPQQMKTESTSSSSSGGSSSPTSSSMRRVMSEAEMVENGGKRYYKIRKSSLIGMINWTHVLCVYLPQLFLFGTLILVAQIVHQVVTGLVEASALPHDSIVESAIAIAAGLQDLFGSFFDALVNHSGGALFAPAVRTTAVVLVVIAWIWRMDNPVYLLAFATFKAPDSWKASHEQIMKMMELQDCFTPESLNFMRRILERSGTGQATAWPPGIIQCLDGKKTDRTVEGSRQEAKIVLFDIVKQALEKAHTDPKEIDVLVINCSLFSPTPSLCAMVVSEFGMRSDVKTFNLGGMGCSASLISIDLAKSVLQSNNHSGPFFGGGKALVVSTEIITPNLYHGNERGFLIQNTLFRCGGAAMVLSNKWSDGRRAWYKLLHTVRVQGTGADAYNAVYETQDADGERGVKLSKDIVKVAGQCMAKNLTILGPHVLALNEQFKVLLSMVGKFLVKLLFKALRACGKEGWAKKYLPDIKNYVPDFKRGIDHFCIHAGGRAVIDGIEGNMKLEEFHTEPSRMALLNYGNTSSSSIWYELEYIQEEQKNNPLKKGHRIMQVAFGSGFKCTSGVWLKL